jgi:hypothetical protein
VSRLAASCGAVACMMHCRCCDVVPNRFGYADTLGCVRFSARHVHAAVCRPCASKSQIVEGRSGGTTRNEQKAALPEWRQSKNASDGPRSPARGCPWWGLVASATSSQLQWRASCSWSIAAPREESVIDLAHNTDVFTPRAQSVEF